MAQNLINNSLLVSPVKPPVLVRKDDKPSDFSKVIAKQNQAAKPEDKSQVDKQKNGNLKPSNGKDSSEENETASADLDEELLEDQLSLGELSITATGVEYVDKQFKDIVSGKGELKIEIELLGQKSGMQLQSLLATKGGGEKPDASFNSIALNTLNDVNISTIQKPDLSIPTKVGSPNWGDALAGRISLLVNQRINSAKIHLTPPELGPIEVRVNLNNEQASVQFISHSASVRDALEQAMPRLREMLESSGFSLAEGHVGEEAAQDDQSRARDDEALGASFEQGDTPLIQEVQIGLIDDYA